jgi:hypothetical protein
MAIENSDDPYPFADLALARRLEKTEAQGNVNFVEARAKAFPKSEQLGSKSAALMQCLMVQVHR